MKRVSQASLFDSEPEAPHPADVPEVGLRMMESSCQTVTYHAWPCRVCRTTIPRWTPIIREYWMMTDGSRDVRWQCLDCWWKGRAK